MEHVNFTTELSEKLAKDIITFCKEWGMWEHLLDMTYEGPLYMLIHNLEYEVNPHNLSDTAKEYICSHDERILDAIEYECIERADDYMENHSGWDPAEHYYNGGTIANHVLHEFGKIFERYGLWYEPGFSWSLTTYRQTYGKKRREVR